MMTFWSKVILNSDGSDFTSLTYPWWHGPERSWCHFLRILIVKIHEIQYGFEI